MQFSKINYADSQYPSLLRELHAPRKPLYVAGKLLSMPLVAIVGTRRPTSYGEQVTYQLASRLAKAGIGIISGLAIGIDAVAHKGALDAGGYTIAVLGSGLGKLYPARNRGLANQIYTSGGAIITEYEYMEPPLPFHFPQRNEVIAGMSLATIVTEADTDSGSLITAKLALEQNRLVMAVPGNITSQRSSGPNEIIRNGATPVTSVADILEALQMDAQVRLPLPPIQTGDEATILGLIDNHVTAAQEIITRSGLSAARFAEIISIMEIQGAVKQLGSSAWVRR